MARSSKMPGSDAEAKLPAPSTLVPATAIHPGLLMLARLLLVIALGVSAYLAWVSISHGAVAGCGPESNCDRVLQSRWSRWFGVPVSIFAVVVDALVLCGTFLIANSSKTLRDRGGHAAACGSLLILGAGLWFVILQVSGVGICPYCMTAHGAGMVAALILLSAMRSGSWIPQTAPVAGMALALLVAGQLIQKAPGGRESQIHVATTNLPTTLPAVRTQVVATPTPTQSVVAPRVPAASNVAAMVAASNPPPAAAATNPVRQTYTVDMGPVSAMKRPFTFYEGLFGIDLFEVPVIGAPTNNRVVISLFDYSCHHCRAMHPLLEEIQRAFSNDLVMVSLPMPLDEKCNHTVKRTPTMHLNACAYAHIGMAVWRANRSKHTEFDEWMMTGPEPPAVQAAVMKAVSLVGSNAFGAAVKDPWLSRQVQFDVAIYDVAYRSGHGSMPQLIVGSTVSEGMRTREELLKLLADQYGLKAK